MKTPKPKIPAGELVRLNPKLFVTKDGDPEDESPKKTPEQKAILDAVFTEIT